MSVYFYGCVTLDGYLADKNHRIDWLHELGTVEETGYQEFYDQMDITIMGKKTFDEVCSIPDYEAFYPSTKNYVFTHQESLEGDTFSPIAGDVSAFVKTIPADKNIWIVGGNAVLAPLLDNDQVDTIILQIAPVLLGEGVPLFTQKEGIQRWHLEKMNQYGQFAELVLTKK